MLKVDVRDCYKYMPFDPEDLKIPKDATSAEVEAQMLQEIEEQDKDLLEKNKFYIKLR
jgi:hypothetical protein